MSLLSNEHAAKANGGAAGAKDKRRARRRNWPYALQMVVLDAALTLLAFWVAWWLRYEMELVAEVATENYLSFGDYQELVAAFIALVVVVAGLKGLYRETFGRTWLDEVVSIFSTSMVATALLVIAVFYYRPFSYSRAIFIFALVLTVAFLSLARLVRRQLVAQWRKRGRGLRRVVIVGAGTSGRRIMQSIVAQTDLDYEVVGFVDDERSEDLGRFKALGKLEDLPEVMTQHAVDEVIVALPSTSHEEVMRIINLCGANGVEFRLVPDFYGLSLDRVDMHYLHGIPLIGLREPSLRGWNWALKRAMDVSIAAVALVLFAPLMALVALAIKLDSPGPVLFRQLRVGRGGRRFWFYKFRSMRADAEQEFWQLVERNEAKGPIFKMRKDPRVTRVGAIIRRTSIDELPQLFNVLAGDMSLVGPRPPLPHEVEQYEEWHLRRLEVAPGITGLWQVSGRSELTFDEMVLLDLWYIENWYLGLDLKIILRTIPAVLFERGAF